MANIRRLIFKRFGGTSNFISVTLLLIIFYLIVKSYFKTSPASKYTPQHPDPTNLDLHKLQKEYDLVKQSAVIKPEDPGATHQIKVDADLETLDNRKHDKLNMHHTLPDPGVFDKECVIAEKCAAGQIPYFVKSGDGMEGFPIICFNGKVIFAKFLKDSKIGRGINMVVLDKDTFAIKSAECYDTFNDDSVFYRYVKTGIVDGDIVMLASYDEMANSLRETSSLFMQFFGSQMFTNVKFRDSYAMIGQRGIMKGKAIEIHEPKHGKDFAPAAVLSGCARFPLGIIHPVKQVEMQVNDIDKIVVKDVVINCGMRENCKKDEFAVHVYSGLNGEDEPKICVDGRYVIAKGINDAGRGINIVVVGNGKEILKTAHFDTYQEDSTNLEIFLESLYENTIIIAITFDEASAKLGTLARNLFFDLGSGLVQNLRFRDSWFFVGRKGIEGFTPIEEISYAGPDDAFPKVIDKKFCVPQTLTGLRIRPDPLPNMNDGRRDFCSRYDGYGDFCTNENMDKPLKPAPIINKTLEDHPVYNMPIYIVGGMSHNSLRMTLETVIMQPGIRTDLVYVCMDEKLTEQFGLVELFGFQYVKIESSYNYTEIYHKCLQQIWHRDSMHRDKKSVVIIEEELILSPDFLYYFSKVYDVYINDDSIGAVSAWNFNSFLQIDGSPNYVYRTDEFPGLGYMLKKSVYDSFMHGKLESCCADRAWNNWILKASDGNAKRLDVIVPDVSRVFRRPYDLSKSDFSYLKNLFNRKRKTNLMPFPDLKDLESLSSIEKYNSFLKGYLKNAQQFDVKSCYENNKISLPATNNQNYKVVYEQTSKYDLSKLKILTKCFHLFNYEDYKPKGLYVGNVLRFNAHQNNFILVGSMSEILL